MSTRELTKDSISGLNLRRRKLRLQESPGSQLMAAAALSRQLVTPDSRSSSGLKESCFYLSTRRLLDLATMPPSAVATSDDLIILVAAGMFITLRGIRMFKFALTCLPRGASDHSGILKRFLKIYVVEHAGLDAILKKVVVIHMQILDTHMYPRTCSCMIFLGSHVYVWKRS